MRVFPVYQNEHSHSLQGGIPVDTENPALHSDRFFLRITEKIVIFGQNWKNRKNHLTNPMC